MAYIGAHARNVGLSGVDFSPTAASPAQHPANSVCLSLSGARIGPHLASRPLRPLVTFFMVDFNPSVLGQVTEVQSRQ